MGAAETRYAEALFKALTADANPLSTATPYSAATPSSQILAADSILSDLSHALCDMPMLMGFVTNPIIPAAIRKETVLAVMTVLTQTSSIPDVSDAITHFIALLIDRHRLRQLPAIYDAFHRKVAQAEGRLEITVTSAQPLADDQLSRLRALYIKRYRARSAHITRVIDPTILGGVRVQVGDRITDGTLRGRLRDLHSAITDTITDRIADTVADTFTDTTTDATTYTLTDTITDTITDTDDTVNGTTEGEMPSWV